MTYQTLPHSAQLNAALVPWKLDLDRESAPIAGILSAAESCFARAGYEGASMREIAEVAGVSKSLLHYHFDSKEHLFVEVQIRAYNRLAARVLAAAAFVESGAERGLLAFDALFTTLREKNELATQRSSGRARWRIRGSACMSCACASSSAACWCARSTRSSARRRA